MSTVKRCISLLLVMVILMGVFSPAAQAASSEETASVNTDNVTIEGTNGFGNLLSQEIAESQEEVETAEAEYPGGYTVTDLVIEGNTATVTYDTMEEATLVVALYTEDGMQMLASTTATVTPDATEAELTFAGDMPEYFMASAYLLDVYDFSPLCAAYDTPMYTQEMQELLASTVNDYDPEKVLNLDDDETTNFAVYSDSTIVIEPVEGVNVVASVDEETLTYVIEDVDATISTLVEGDVLVYRYDDNEIIIVKVANITTEGTTSIITGAEIEMEDIFSAVKIEGKSDTNEVVVDDSTADQGVAFEGIQAKGTPGYGTDSLEGGGSFEYELVYKIDKTANYGSITEKIEGKLGIGLETSIDYYISGNRQFIEFAVDYYLLASISAEGTLKTGIPLGKFSVVPVFGVYCYFEPELSFEAKGAVEIEIKCGSFTKTVFESGKGLTCYVCDTGCTFDGTKEIEYFIGLDLNPGIAIIDKAILNMQLSAKTGLILTVKQAGKNAIVMDSSSEVIHSCNICFDLELSFSAEFKVTMFLLGCKERAIGPVKLETLIFEAYRSTDYDEFLPGNCPHLEYRITFQAIDAQGNGIGEIAIYSDTGDVWGTTNKHGVVVHYVPKGKYTIQAVVNEENLSKTIDVKEAMLVTMNVLHDKVDGYGSVFTGQPADGIVDYGTIVSSGECGDALTWVLYSGGLLSIEGQGAMDNYSHSPGFWGSRVPWYKNRSEIKYIVIGSNVTTIGRYAFSSCEGLISVKMPDSVTIIGDNAFQNCGNLQNISISNSIITIGDYAFQNCRYLQSIEIPNTVEYIGEHTFEYCDSLSGVIIPDSVSTIAKEAFSHCDKLMGIWVAENNPNYSSDGSGVLFDKDQTQLIQAPGGIVGDYDMPNSVTIIGNDAFSSCDHLFSVVISESVTIIGERAFEYCRSLNTALIPNSVTTISEDAFYSCGNLKIMTIPSNVVTIGMRAFDSCTSLSSVSIPESVNTIGAYAFESCENLTGIWVDESNPNYSSDSRGVLFNKSKTELIQAPGGIIGDYQIPDSVTTIEKFAFYRCANLTGIWIPESNWNYSNDSRGVLFDKSQTELIQAPGGIIGDYIIPDSVTTVDRYAFEYCVRLSSVTIGNSVETIWYSAFVDCPALETVTFKGDAPEIDEWAFTGQTIYAYYPANNPTWTNEVLRNYGGDLTWIPYTHTKVNVVLDELTDIQTREPTVDLDAVYGGGYETIETDSATIKTATFSNLVPNEQYVLLAMISVEVDNPLAEENLLAIDQGCSTEDGTLTFRYIQRTPMDISYVVACGASNKNLNDAVITFPKMIEDGKLHVVEPAVVYDNETLIEGLDYIITGIVDYTAAGEYTCYIRGVRKYTGLVKCTYTVDVSENPFIDVTPGSFYYEPVMWAVENGITNGTSATTFGPNDQCMRAHVVTFLWRAVGSPEPTRTDNPFVDVPENAFYYKPVLWALENGITSGMDATHFGPTSYCNRAQVVTFLYRTMGSPDLESAENPFTDVAEGSFYEKPVLWAVKNGITNGLSATTFGPGSICNRAQIVTFLYRAFVND